ncbi:mucosa-associated lymphoid tissue lymphoma translocation protein 1-like isoform X2 [Carettochelys insculpta]|uniref:mucosa-associated lymphoid tissue lymphoma translocation protein 1-like isoform X2 n=1 Tax=Carettochelys insculpta TaxID=44489 RepID=UPI003EBE17CF
MPKAVVITEQPTSASVPAGYSLTLRCRATACTNLRYQWFSQRQAACCPIAGATEPDLLLTARETQVYVCRINDLYRNVAFSNWVRAEVHQHVAKGLLPKPWHGEPVVVLNPTAPEVKVGQPLQLVCAALGVPAPHYQWYHNGNPMKHQKKKKLLISSAKLSDSGTYLCCAANEHGEHWTEAVELRVAVFYYAGHGYEHSGRNYMVPIDAPQPYAPENCLSVQRILQKMQQRRTALNLILLDTCRKWYNPQCALSQVQPLEPWGNIVYGYATSEDAEAYEVQDGEFSAGIFMKYLKKHILQEKKVTHMLEDVLEDIGRDPLVTGKQVMEIKHTLKEARALTDPICTSRPIAELWGHSRELLKETLTFPCGIQVELRFRVVFSNVMHVSAKLQAPPPHIADVRLLLCRPTEVQELAMLSDSQSNQVVSLLASLYEQEDLDCVLRLCGLQKIQTDVRLQLDLHYTQLGTKQRACESLQKTLQKSLFAKLFSQKSWAYPPCLSSQGAAATTGPLDAPAVNAAQEGPCSLRAKPRHSGHCNSQSNTSSEPEENDESDLSSLYSALERAGLRQDCP